MILQKIQLGQIGEEAAVSFLERQGYKIVEQNFRNTLGEIDIIAYDGDTICFIEVKTRNSDIFGSPFDSVPVAKQRKIARVALSYLKFKGKYDEKARFDVIAVFVCGDSCQNVEIIKNAFETYWSRWLFSKISS